MPDLALPLPLTPPVGTLSLLPAAEADDDFFPSKTPNNPVTILYPQNKFNTFGNTNALAAIRTAKGNPEAALWGLVT